MIPRHVVLKVGLAVVGTTIGSIGIGYLAAAIAVDKILHPPVSHPL